MNSSAVVTNCFAGTNSPAYLDAVIRRINWYRAMAGIPAVVTLNATFNQKDQQAALIMAANNSLSHTPSPSWSCYTADGADAAGNSNLALGNAGPDAVDAFIWDSGANNAVVGHRRWLLYPQTQVMGTGDVPAQNGHYAANAIWVFDGNFGTARPATRQPFVSWPPSGFVPYQTVYGRWSFAYPQADLTSARVFMKSNGVPLSVNQAAVENGYGENTLVWIPAGLDANGYDQWSRPATDIVYSITISNVAGIGTNWFSYAVTVFDPDVPGPDYHPPVIAGTNQPAVGQPNVYTFTAVSNATGYQWRQTQRLSFNWSDGAENGLTNFVVSTSPGYAVQQNGLVASGAYAFHLAHPAPPTDQTLRLNRLVFPTTNTALIFKSRLGWATPAQLAKVQASLDDGLTWQDLYSQAGNNTSGDSVWYDRSISLAGLAGKAVFLRFNYHYENQGGSFFPQVSLDVGWAFDSIILTNAEELAGSVIASVAGTNFVFTPTQAGNYNLDVRPVVFSDFALDWGVVKSVTAITTAPPTIISLTQPAFTSSQVRIDFARSSGNATTFTLLRADQVTGPWTNDSAAVLTTNAPGSYRFTTPRGTANNRYYRVRTP